MIQEGHEWRGSNLNSLSPHPDTHKAVTNKKEKEGKNSRMNGDTGAHRCWELAAYIYHSTQVAAPLASFSWKGRGDRATLGQRLIFRRQVEMLPVFRHIYNEYRKGSGS